MAVLSHNEINLSRLVRRLEKSAEDSNGAAPTANDQDTWITAQSTLQVRTFRRVMFKIVLNIQPESEARQEAAEGRGIAVQCRSRGFRVRPEGPTA